jgi:hypothetical protein
MRQIRCVFIVLFLGYSSAHALEVDASKFGFVFQLPKGWKVVRNSNPYSRPLLIVNQDRKVGMTARVVNNYVLPRGDLHYAAAGWALARGAKSKIIETSPFRTSSNDVGLCTKFDVTTKDGQKLKQLSYSFELREFTYVCVSCNGPADVSFDQTIDSIMKTFRLIR